MSAKTATYVIKSGGRPSGDPSKYDFSEIQSLLDATNPAKVSGAGFAYNTAAQIMAQVAHELYRVGTGLAAKWEGADATAAQKALGQLYTTANELYWRSQQAGGALQTYGAALNQYKGLKWPAGGASPVEDTARQQAAQKVMQSLNQHIGNAWDAMPDKVQTNLPGLTDHTGEGAYPSGPKSSTTGSGSPAPSSFGGRSASPGHTRSPHLPHGGGGSSTGGSADDHRTELAGASPVSAPAAPPSTGNAFSPGTPSGGPSPGGGFTPGGMPPSLPGGRFGPGSFRGEGPGPREIPSEQPLPHARSLAGSPENAATTEQAEAAQARPGLMGPGGATAAGAGSGERPRSTWLSEDRKIWAAGEEPAPGVLGAGPASGHTDEEEGTERERTVWLDEEREVWTGGETALQGTIGAVPSRPGAAGATQEDEPDILDVAQLQKLLDSLDQDGEAPGDGSKRRRQSVGLFDDVAEMNEFGRLLNG